MSTEDELRAVERRTKSRRMDELERLDALRTRVELGMGEGEIDLATYADLLLRIVDARIRMGGL